MILKTFVKILNKIEKINFYDFHFVIVGFTNDVWSQNTKIISCYNLQRYEVFMVSQVQERWGRARWGRQPARHTLTVEWATGALALQPPTLTIYPLPSPLPPNMLKWWASRQSLPFKYTFTLMFPFSLGQEIFYKLLLSVFNAMLTPF